MDRPTLLRRGLRLAGLLLIWLAIAVGILGVVEVGLRLTGKGYSMQPFIEVHREGTSYHVLNDRFYNQYFRDHSLADMSVPSNTVVRTEKPENTFRAFVFGGSAANGWLFQEHSLTTLLQLQLSGLYPDKRIEVYNVAYAALNSHVMRRVAEACSKLDPDLFVIYMGNNEFVGPYSPQSVIGSKRYSKSFVRFIIRCQNLLSESRLYQVIREPVQKRASRAVEHLEWGRDAPVQTMDDPRLERTYQLYEDNLRRMCAVGQEVGGRVALCTVAYNLRDWPPMLWQHRVDITEDERARWQVHLDQGLALQEQGQLEAACAEYDTAMAIDDHPANLLYQRARCLLELGRNEEALEGFLAAGDNCYTRTAANRRINGIIGNLAEEDPNDAVFLVDTEQALRDASPEGIPGAGQFFDHMHLTYEATFTIVTAVAKAILSQVGSGDPAGLYSLDESRVPMAFTLGEELRQLETAEPWVLKSHEPYSKAYLAERKNELRAQISTQGDTPLPDGPDLMPRQDFWLLRNALVTRLMNEARYEEALEHCQRLVSKYPAVWGFWQRLILTQLYAGHRDKAVEEARAATRTYPSYSASWTQLGLALMDASGSLDEAVAAYGMAVTLSPGNRPVLESYARTLAAAGRFEECLEALEEAPADIAFDRTQRALILRHGLEQCAGSGDCPTAARGLDVLLALDSNFEHVRPLLAMCGNAHDRAAMLEACRRHNVAIPPEFVSQP